MQRCFLCPGFRQNRRLCQWKCDGGGDAYHRHGRALRAGKKSAKAAIAEALKEVEEANREDAASGAENTENQEGIQEKESL